MPYPLVIENLLGFTFGTYVTLSVCLVVNSCAVELQFPFENVSFPVALSDVGKGFAVPTAPQTFLDLVPIGSQAVTLPVAPLFHGGEKVIVPRRWHSAMPVPATSFALLGSRRSTRQQASPIPPPRQTPTPVFSPFRLLL